MASNPKVLLLSAEVAPFAKTGGLADVAGSLPKVLRELGCDVRVAMPKHKVVQYLASATCPITDRMVSGEIERTTATLGADIPIYFVKNDHYFYRDSLYGYGDDAERFTFYQRAVLDFIKTIGWKPDVIHCNDWQTGLIPVYLKTILAKDPFYSGIATVFTIHNLAYQGCFDRGVYPVTGLPWDHFNMNELEYYGQVNYMKAGLVFADMVNTVSEKYAEEIQTDEYGEGLQGVLRERKKMLTGVINGIDYDIWNPATDKALPAQYDVNSIENKAACKEALQKSANLPVKRDVPVIGLISRLSEQKGFDILAQAVDKILALGVQLVILGTGDPYYMDLFAKLGKKHPESVAIFLKFDDKLAHQIYAGSDLFLMPSRYEPCGLSQMISLRYGTIPIVRATGGLADTITEFDPKAGTGNGFSFQEYSTKELLAAVQRGVNTYKQEGDWRKLAKNGMECDFSWQASARKYVELYEKAIAARKKAT